MALAIRRAVLDQVEAPVSEILFVKPGQVLRTSSGKVQRNACRKAMHEGRFEAVGRWCDQAVDPIHMQAASVTEMAPENVPPQILPVEIIRDLIVKEVAASCNLKEDQVNPGKSLHEFDLDSLAIHTLALHLEETVGFHLSATTLQHSSIDELSARYMSELAKADLEIMEL